MRADEIRHTRRKAVRAMKSSQARVGGFYVNESKGLVREITQETPNGNLCWRSYDLRTGSPTGDSLACSPGRIVQWADREATAEETAGMRRSDADFSSDERIDKIVDFVIKNIPDDRLFAEVQRRGYRVI
jgi:hypothetical protein